MDEALVLRDIHLSSAPPGWPPAPGGWLLAVTVLAAAAALVAWRMLVARRRRRLLALFDAEVAAAPGPAEAVAAMSALLRRAARRRDPSADRLVGRDWLAFLDAGRDPPRFEGGLGTLLLEGPFQRDADAAAVADLRQAARARFIEWMEGRA